MLVSWSYIQNLDQAVHEEVNTYAKLYSTVVVCVQRAL